MAAAADWFIYDYGVLQKALKKYKVGGGMFEAGGVFLCVLWACFLTRCAGKREEGLEERLDTTQGLTYLRT